MKSIDLVEDVPINSLFTNSRSSLDNDSLLISYESIRKNNTKYINENSFL